DDLGTSIDHGTPSKEYHLHETIPTDMLFYVMYRATAASVTAGATEAYGLSSVPINLQASLLPALALGAGSTFDDTGI
ncbi:hypothetical protein RA262_29390, partial [Pseudomonas syringae pv. tagetis]